MTRDIAETIVKGLLSATATINDNLFLLKGAVPEITYEQYRKRSAEVMADIYLDLVKPIVRDYPDLDPGSRD